VAATVIGATGAVATAVVSGVAAAADWGEGVRAGSGVAGTAVAGALADLAQAAVKPASPTTSAWRRRMS
jgi:hypothetical protein